MAFVQSDQELPCGKYSCAKPILKDAKCTGFKIRDEDRWDTYAIFQNGTCVEPIDADDPYDFTSNYLCCADDESECCEDYPAGFYAGFGIGVGGVACMVLYAVYLCFGKSPAPKVEG